MTTTPAKDATLIFFNDYTVHYYSQSSAPWEAAYINCFQNCDGENDRYTGRIVFTYPHHSQPPGQESVEPGTVTEILAGQVNHLEKDAAGKDYFVIYYDINRFNDVINLLRFAITDVCAENKKSMFVSANPDAHVWALCNNLHMLVGAQYEK
jgi:hypothetical protein